MLDFSHTLFVLVLFLQLMLSVAVGMSVGGGMRVEDLHIKEGAFISTSPKNIGSNI